MGYMVVEKHTSDLLHLKRSPGIRSWSLLVGMRSFVKREFGEVCRSVYHVQHKISFNVFLLPLFTGIASVGLAAAYYSAGEKCFLNV